MFHAVVQGIFAEGCLCPWYACAFDLGSGGVHGERAEEPQVLQ